jgi:transposase
MRLHDVSPADLEFDSLQLPPNFGLVLPVCRDIGIARIIDDVCPMKWDGGLTHGQVIEAMVLHILQSADRVPLYRVQEWAQEHSLGLLYDCPAEAFNDDRIGRALDALVPPRFATAPVNDDDDTAGLPADVIEEQVVRQAITAYRIPVNAVHWDLTHITFTGAYDDAALIGPGYGSGTVHRKQIQMSLHASTDSGIPLHHRCLSSRAQQQPLAEQLLASMQKRLNRSDLIVVTDGKGISFDIIGHYRAAGAHFVSTLKPTEEQERLLASVALERFERLDYAPKRKSPPSYCCYPTTLSLCPRGKHKAVVVDALFMHSTGKQQRDEKTRRKSLDKAYAALAKINGQLNKLRYARADYAQQQLAKAVPPEVANIVCYELAGEDRQLTLRWWTDLQALAQTACRDGRYILAYDLPTDKVPQDAFFLYKRQYLVEARFRGLKSDLVVNPLWLKNENRVVAMVFVFVLALMVFAILGLLSERAGLSTEYYYKMTPREMLIRFGGIKMLLVRVRDGPPQCEIELTVEQGYLLHELGFRQPGHYLPHLKPDHTIGSAEYQ